jgi:hypothetical protein
LIPITNNPTVHPPFFKCLRSLKKVRIKLFGLNWPRNLLNSTFCVVYQCLTNMWVRVAKERHRTHIFSSYCNHSIIANLSPFGRYVRNAPELGLIRTLSLYCSTLKKGGCGLHSHNCNLLQSLSKRRISRFASPARVRVWEAYASPTLHLHIPELVRTTRPRTLPLELCVQGASRCHNQLLANNLDP